MTTVVSYGPWAEEALFSKCRLYIEKMERHRPDEWEFALWSSLALELLARACLARVSPALLADDKNWHNINFALGRAPITKKFTPISIGMSEVMRRLGEIYPEITQEVVGFVLNIFKEETRSCTVENWDSMESERLHGCLLSIFQPKLCLM